MRESKQMIRTHQHVGEHSRLLLSQWLDLYERENKDDDGADYSNWYRFTKCPKPYHRSWMGVVCFRKKRQCDAADEEDGCSSENRKQYRRKYARQSIDVVERHRSYR